MGQTTYLTNIHPSFARVQKHKAALAEIAKNAVEAGMNAKPAPPVDEWAGYDLNALMTDAPIKAGNAKASARVDDEFAGYDINAGMEAGK